MISKPEKARALFKGSYEWFGIWIPLYFGAILAMAIFWGSGEFNPRGIGFWIYTLVILLIQMWLLSKFYTYRIFDDRIHIKYHFKPNRIGNKIIQIQDINYVLHDSSKHSGGLYTTQHLIVIGYGANNIFKLTVSKYGTKLDEILDFFRSKVDNTKVV